MQWTKKAVVIQVRNNITNVLTVDVFHREFTCFHNVILSNFHAVEIEESSYVCAIDYTVDTLEDVKSIHFG